LLVVVDGRQPSHSIGMTLLELAKLMQDLGAKAALNLDGGGSSEMVIGEEFVNRPSDGRERLVGDALVITKVQ
jgi:exopolysaccharide biosynthesis protein